MKRMLILLMLLMVMTTVVAMVGCSDDDNGDGTVTGNNNDPNFEGIVDVSDGAADMTVNLIAVNFALTGSIADAASARSGVNSFAAVDAERDVDLVDVTHTYNASSGWHVLTVDSAYAVKWQSDVMPAQSDTTYFKGIDSLRFTDTAGQYLNTNLDTGNVRTIEFRAAYEIHGTNTPDINDTASFTMTGHFGETYTVNGTSHGTVEEPMTGTTCGATGHFTQTFTNLPLNDQIVYGDEDCPASGMVSLNINLAADCPTGVEPDSEMVLGDWTVTMSFSNGQIHLTASDGTTTWTANDWCGPDPTDISASDSAFVEDAISGEQLGNFFYDIPISETLLDDVWQGLSVRVSPPRLNAQDFDQITVSVTNPTYNNGWWTINFTADLIQTDVDTIYLSGIDSVRVYEGGIVVQTPNNPDNIEELDVRMHADWYNDDTVEPSEGSIHHSVDYVAVDIGGNKYAQGNGTIADTANVVVDEGMESGCTIATTSNQTMTNLTFNPGSGGCPVSGQLTANATISTDCWGGADDHYNANGDWTLTVVANGDGTVTLTFNNGYTNWTITETCGD